ncbi:MAG: type II toxin-antitoxin system PemK/MazF family toxin [Saprospiraceae bacterium]
MELHQYQIVIVNLDPTIGSEIRKTRPCVIVSPDEMNRHLQTVTVCPITSTSKKYPTRLKVMMERKVSWIVVDQIRTLDRKRIFKIVGQLTQESILNLKAIIRETYVD